MSDKSDHTGSKSQPYIEPKYRQVLEMGKSDEALQKLLGDLAGWDDFDTYEHHFVVSQVLNWFAIDDELFMKKYWSAFHMWREEDRQIDGAKPFHLAKYLLLDYVRVKRGLK